MKAQLLTFGKTPIQSGGSFAREVAEWRTWQVSICFSNKHWPSLWPVPGAALELGTPQGTEEMKRLGPEVHVLMGTLSSVNLPHSSGDSELHLCGLT